MSAIIYGLSQTRITLYAVDGVTPTRRYTLQKEDSGSLELSFPPEGTTHNLGAGANYARQINFNGYRPTLKGRWAVAVDPSHQQTGQLVTTVEIWGGATWGVSSQVNTAAALGVIDDASRKADCLVEPHLDKAFSFMGHTPLNHVYMLKDRKGVVHTELALWLEATILIPSMPDWLNI